MWLFRLPLVALTLKACERTALVKSLVEVLPFEPVMQTTGMSSLLRHQCASRWSAKRVSGTAMTALPSGTSPPSHSLTMATEAPASRAFSANMSPLKLSPLRAMKRPFGAGFLVSVKTESTCAEAEPATSVASRASMICRASAFMVFSVVGFGTLDGGAGSLIRYFRSVALGWLAFRRFRWSACGARNPPFSGHRSRWCGRRTAGRSHGLCRRSG